MTRSASDRAVGLALAAGAVFLFSIRPILIKLAYGYARDPVTLIALRMVFSLPFFLAAALWVRGRAGGGPISRRDAVAIAGLGFLGYYLASFFDFLGLQYISAGLARLLLFLYPTLVVALSWVALRKPAGARELAALAITYVGLAIVLARSVEGQHENLPLGAALVFASAAAYAVYLVAGTEVIRRVGSVRFTALALSWASLAVILQFLLLRPFSALELPWQVYALAAAMAIGCTVAPTFMTAEALRRVGANETAIVGALGPVSTIALGWLGLDERMTLAQILGSFLVVGGVLLVSLKPRR
ncbi:MAG: DMT family transporter [Burkholderiales bacterium]|nr:DMT family transporter [Burkholderiales bacterium]